MLHSVIMAEMMQQLGMPHIGYMRQPFGDKKTAARGTCFQPLLFCNVRIKYITAMQAIMSAITFMIFFFTDIASLLWMFSLYHVTNKINSNRMETIR